jgi:uncharacterized protein YndB with AHSA1/START domain
LIQPLRISLQVECPAERAFDVWTRRISTWWPLSHTVSAERGLQIVLEPRIGGRIFERTTSGQEHDWGEITRWDPPHCLGYVWYLRQDRADATEVEVCFRAVDASTTLVQITHQGWENLGARGPDLREANQAGWSGLLPQFVKAVNDKEL